VDLTFSVSSHGVKLWELDGNTLGTREKHKKSLPAHPLKNK
jgi:hypothetical protein